VNGLWLRAAGAGRQYVPAALDRRFWAALNFVVRQHVKRQRKRLASSPKRTPRRHPPAGVTFEHVRRIALTFPGVEDGTSYGTPTLKVRGKLLARRHQSIDCLVLRSDFLRRHILIQSFSLHRARSS